MVDKKLEQVGEGALGMFEFGVVEISGLSGDISDTQKRLLFLCHGGSSLRHGLCPS